MVANNSLDQLDDALPGYEQIGPEAKLFSEGTLFEDGVALDIHQKHSTPNRLSVELAHTWRIAADDQYQKDRAEQRELNPTLAEQLRQMKAAGQWIEYHRKEKLNPIQPVTRQEFIGNNYQDGNLAA